MIVDGVRIDEEAEVLDLVRKQIATGRVWIEKEDQGNLDGLTRAVREAGDLTPAFADAILTLLSDEDRTVRTAAVNMLSEVADQIGAEALVELLEARPELFRGVKPARKFSLFFDDLAGAVLVEIGRVAAPDDTRAIEVLRAAAEGKYAWEVASSLASLDADWLCDHASLVPRRTLGSVLLSLPTPEHRERVVRALAPWPKAEREKVLAKRYWDTLDADQAEVDKLKKIVAGE